MKFLLLNQFDDASGAPTGRILAELGSELGKRGHHVSLVTSDAVYGNSRHGASRIIQEGLSHFVLVWKSLWRPRADVVISLTSPACLAVTATVITKIHRARHFHWAMDLYPDVGVRLGELKNGALSRLLSYLMRRAYQSADQVITLDEDMRRYLRDTHGVDSTVIEPFPAEVTWPTAERGYYPNRQWLYSGNFGRAHEIEALLQVQKKLEDRQVNARLLLQGKGPQFLLSRELADQLDLRQVDWREPVPAEKLAESLYQSEVLVVTRKPELKGLLLPSKLLLAELSGRRVLWIGDTDGATAQRLSKQGAHGVFSVREIEAIATWLQGVFEHKFPADMSGPVATEPVRQTAFQQWETLLLE